MANALADATSPYLLQHKDNPVAWRPWGPEALAEARRLDRPILLSVGYAACHWCHVMAHESFEDPATAELVNRHFVPIKVDREERPDVDALYQQALALLGQPGGWPLTMFLTPEGEAFWGGTYFPPEPRFGRPGFRQVLARIAELWAGDRDRLFANRDAIREALGRLNRPERGALDPDARAAAARRLASLFDPAHGGLGGPPKFPQAPVLAFLWRMARHHALPELEQPVLHTLRRICQGGIYDHLGGGFARYAVDERWLVPHFEKMLYDNGQLLELLAEAHAATGDPLFATRIAETVGWLEREMLTEGGFAASLDADSEGEEGRYYLWTPEEIEAVLGPDDAARFGAVYGVAPEGNFEGRTVLARLGEQGLRPPAEEAELAALRARLLEARHRRVPPARDDKVLADWNG
ncbi:MAG TPA: thioredoxin domain-containing protein, partial [Rhodospirillales bacterium]|nr:thioredoxin domain-containing protein [Rhodospirillales bacterium]